jgi:hypothetical protein
VEGTPFREVEEVLDRHARRLAGQLGKLLIDVGEALRNEARREEPETPAGQRRSSEPTREDLYGEATRLGIKGRSRMSKEQLRAAVARARRQR